MRTSNYENGVLNWKP